MNDISNNFQVNLNNIQKSIVMFPFLFSTSDVVSAAAAFISFYSFVAAIWQGWITRSHNRKTVKPMLVWISGRTFQETGIMLQFSIKNHGVGPAIVEGQYFKLNGDVIPPIVGGDYIRDIVEQFLGRKYNYVLRRHGLPGIGSAIPAGGECIVAELEFLGMREDVMDAIYKSIKVTFHLSYKSLYGDRQTLTS